MLKAVQTTLEKGEEKKEMSLYDWYAKVLEDDKVSLQRICKVLVADSAFSKRPFIDKVMKMGFHVVSRLRHDAALFYIWDGEPTGKPGRPRVKGDKTIGRLKAQMVNAYYAQRIIDVFEKNPNTPLNKERINDIFSFDTDAA